MVRDARAQPEDCRPIPRTQVRATGAMEGSIMAAIIVTQSSRNSGSAIPMVPGSTPMSRACPTVSTQAGIAIRTIRDHAAARSLFGSNVPPCPVGATGRTAAKWEFRVRRISVLLGDTSSRTRPRPRRDPAYSTRDQSVRPTPE